MFRNKKYIYAVYKERSFSKAADKLFIAQSSLSAMVKKTEREIGLPLFDRSTTPVRLTDCGEKYIRCIEKIIDMENDFENYLNDAHNMKTGSLSVGASTFFVSFILPQIISEYKARYPQIELNLIEADTSRLEQMLFQGELDLIIDNYEFDDKIYKREAFYDETIVLAVPASYGINKQLKRCRLTAADIVQKKHLNPDIPCIPNDALSQIPYLFLRQGNDLRKRIEKISQEAGFQPEIVLKLDQQATAYHVACQGIGATLISDTLVRKVLPDTRLNYYMIDSPWTKRSNYFYYKKSKYVSNAMKAFMELKRI